MRDTILLQTTSRDRQALKPILAALLLLLMAWWALSYHIGEFRGDGSTDSGVLSFVRPSFPRYHISLGQLALSEPGAHEFRFRELPDERMTLMLYVQGKTYFRDSALLTSLHTSIEAMLIDDGATQFVRHPVPHR